jgi:hypothetical protein
MFGFFERHRLVKRGFAASKTRRRRTESELQQTLEFGTWPKVFICIGFMLGLVVLLRSGNENRQPLEVLVALLIFLTSLAQLWINHPKTWEQNSRLLLLLSTMLLHLGIVKLVLAGAVAQARGGVGEFSPSERLQLWSLAVPYAFGPLLTSVLLGRNHGIFTAIYVSIWGAMFGRTIDPTFLVMSLICGFIAVFVTLNVRRRSRPDSRRSICRPGHPAARDSLRKDTRRASWLASSRRTGRWLVTRRSSPSAAAL